MYRRLTFAISILIVLGFVSSAPADLVAQWKFDEGSGTTAKDSVGTANGTLTGGPVWVAGKVGSGALQFNGTSACVDVGTAFSAPAGSLSIALWANIGAWATDWGNVLIGTGVDNPYTAGWNVRRWGPYYAASWPGKPTGALCFTTRAVGGVGDTTTAKEDLPSNDVPPLNGWVHIACVYDMANHMKYIYFNGKDEGSLATTGNAIGATTRKVYIGARSDDPGTGVTGYFTGMIDDVRIYNNPLHATDLAAIMLGIDQQTASNPKPADKATDVLRDADLSWTPAATAVAHDVYFGTVFNDVNSASRTNPMGLLKAKGQDANTYDPGILALGQTYYWRIDEVNGPPNSTIYTGRTWSFTIEAVANPVTGVTATASATATGSSPGKTADGSGIDATDLGSMDTTAMWTSGTTPTLPVWLEYDLGQVYKLAEMWVWNYNSQFEWALGFGIQNVKIEYSADGTSWTKLGDFVFAQGPSVAGQVHDTTVAFGGVAARKVRLTANSNYGGKQYGLSEVRFYSIPVSARQPQPATGSTGLNPNVVLSWRAGREAALHKIYMGTDPNALSLAGSSSTASYTPSGLSLSTKYYWRVDEVNTAQAISTWASDVWNFTTADYVVIDDMESYNDTTNQIFNVWVDGYGTTTNGAIVGVNNSGTTGTFGNTTTVHGGNQSMPLAYTNTATVSSEAKRTFDTAQDWTLYGVKTLTLWFYGDPANSAVQLYLTINSTKVLYNGAAGNLQRARWNQWNLDLTTVATSTLRSVKTLTIGLSGAGTGNLLIDDIRLYKSAPATPVAVNPGTTGLMAYYAFSNNVNDGSGNGNNGTLVGAPTYAAGLAAFGTAMKFNGTTDAVNLGASKAAFNPTGSLSISLWANIGTWSTAWGHVMISNRGESSLGWQLRRYSNNMFCFTTRGTAGQDDMQTNAAPALNQWIQITCVFDNVANTKTIYMNGIQDRQLATTAGGKLAATTFNAYIGCRDAGTNAPDTTSFFSGMLDEIRVFNRALTAGEAEFLSNPTP